MCWHCYFRHISQQHHSSQSLVINCQSNVRRAWVNWPAVELLHSSLTESVSLPNTVHLRLDTASNTDSCHSTTSVDSMTTPCHTDVMRVNITLCVSDMRCSVLWIAFCALNCLRCFDTVGWVSGRVWPVNNWVIRRWRGCLSEARCKWFAYGPADATATPWSLASLKSRFR